MSRVLKRFFVIVCALGALALYGFWFEPSRIRVVEHDIAGADGRSIFAQPLRIAVIGDLHAELAAYYSHTGCPSVDPELMVRMLLVGYCYSIRSERRLCQEVDLNLAYRHGQPSLYAPAG